MVVGSTRATTRRAARGVALQRQLEWNAYVLGGGT